MQISIRQGYESTCGNVFRDGPTEIDANPFHVQDTKTVPGMEIMEEHLQVQEFQLIYDNTPHDH